MSLRESRDQSNIYTPEVKYLIGKLCVSYISVVMVHCILIISIGAQGCLTLNIGIDTCSVLQIDGDSCNPS